MFYALWTASWQTVQVYAVDTVKNKFLVNERGNFTWVDMDEFKPI